MDPPSRFLPLCLSLDVPSSVAASSCLSLIGAYGTSRRHYHTLSHVEAMLAGLDEFAERKGAGAGEEGVDVVAVEFAVWFHDCVYDPLKGAPWNEEESGRRWEKFVEQAGGALEHLREPVSTLIASTISHLPPSPLPSSLSLSTVQLFLNLDISILSSSPNSYDSYAEAIRAEYSHVSVEAFREGRAKVLGRFLARERLFLGGEEVGGGDDKEEKARSNLRREIEALKSGAAPRE
ncbi:hypothetical protein BCR35DRAFT_300637 [Leucosporidium creatinivorum]|uniref:HD domain-containing protein n=1 Tax=Leucosporidium creatinivorum TaxID=106004 RepID=A0A1Y2G149_9BASI|nr:hypothetical protein BCR35DRAFT_300637 [Leucosporidium creatinivorum]